VTQKLSTYRRAVREFFRSEIVVIFQVEIVVRAKRVAQYDSAIQGISITTLYSKMK
jgi:hypothetical protein